LTYVLLRGLGERNLPRPPGLTIFEQYPTADLDQDRWIETGELQQYAQLTVPALAEKYPGLVLRGRAAATAQDRSSVEESAAAIAPAFEPAGSFRLMGAPPPRPAGDRGGR